MTSLNLNLAMRDFLQGRKDLSIRRPESIGKGWIPLLEQLCIQLYRLGWNKEVLQIKEKCGHLCFYVRLKSQPEKSREAIRDVISYYVQKSMTVCERCGDNASIRTGNWIKTLCDHCNCLYLADKDYFYADL